jgi:hypothetical protein
MNNDEDKSLFFTELGKLIRSNNPDQVKESVTRIHQVMGAEIPANVDEEWFQNERDRIVNSFLDYYNSLIKPTE